VQHVSYNANSRRTYNFLHNIISCSGINIVMTNILYNIIIIIYTYLNDIINNVEINYRNGAVHCITLLWLLLYIIYYALRILLYDTPGHFFYLVKNMFSSGLYILQDAVRYKKKTYHHLILHHIILRNYPHYCCILNSE